MKRKTVFVLFTCLIGAVLTVTVLYLISDKIIHEPGNFLRIYPKGIAIEANDMDLELNSWYIADITDDKIYFGNVTVPLQIVETNHTLTDSSHVKLRLAGSESMQRYITARISVIPPYFYYADGMVPCLYRGSIGEWIGKRFMYDRAHFDQSEIIGDRSVAIRGRTGKTEIVLGKIQHVKPYLKVKTDLLEKQLDGIFCTDGMLRFNQNLNKLVYTYYYRNEFLVMDTALNLEYKGHTIDTISRAQIKTADVSEDKYILTQKWVTNRESWTSGKYLFIHSDVLAKNDFPKLFEKMSVIDVYDLTDRTYRFSIPLPKKDKESGMRDFQVYDNKFLIALWGNDIIRYDLAKKYF